jgi:hypothetical protein
MRDFDWVKELVETERRMEESGIIDLSPQQDEARDLQLRTNEFLRFIKETFVDYTTAFNNFKNSTLGSIKIYGISNTVADFMLFRNGYKLIFSATQPGQISISYQTQTGSFLPNPGQIQQSPMSSSEESLMANYGAFGELSWTYRGAPVNPEPLVRHYLSRFIRESAK